MIIGKLIPVGTGFHTRSKFPSMQPVEDELDLGLEDEFEDMDEELEMDDLDLGDIDMGDLSGVAELGMEPLGSVSMVDEDDEDDKTIDISTFNSDDSDDNDDNLG